MAYIVLLCNHTVHADAALGVLHVPTTEQSQPAMRTAHLTLFLAKQLRHDAILEHRRWACIISHVCLVHVDRYLVIQAQASGILHIQPF